MSRRLWLGRMARTLLGSTSLGLFTQKLSAQTLTPAASRPEDNNLTTGFPPVIAGRPLVFPRDHGAHPAYRTEWWYLTAWLEHPAGPLGLQITFFRARTPYGRNNPSSFAPRQLVLAHAAIADPAHGALRHADKAVRANPVSGQFSNTDTDLAVGLASARWSFARSTSDTYTAEVIGTDFSYRFEATPSDHFLQPVLQGLNGFSRKGPQLRQASYYYSRPQLSLSGNVTLDGNTHSITGTGWLDHEWSSEILDPQAEGWDWVGLNLDNGDALMAFQMRSKAGGLLHSTARYVYGAASNDAEVVAEDREVRFSVMRTWISPRTGTEYPVSFRIQTGELDITLEPLMDDQELDARQSTGIIYWEGAVRVFRTDTNSDSTSVESTMIGRGYLELSGYANALAL